ncbi:MAG: tetratricopeptide repeat protein, partial [Hymenobacteraceae bacterium]|nr:tetratricopeptide repeat protein [Hymenobacteraceae bacterium]
ITLDQPAAAIPYLKEARQLNARLGNTAGEAINLTTLGSAHRELRHWDQAIACYTEALRLGHHVPRVVRDTRNQLADLQYRTGQFQAAYQNYRRYTALKDSIFNQETASQLANVEARYHTRDLQRTNQIQQFTIARKNQLAAFGFGTAALVLLAAGALGVLVAQRTRANRRLAAANDAISRAMAEKESLLTEKVGLLAEKEMLLQEVHHRVKNNLQLVSGLLGWQAEADAAAAPALHQSRARLQSMALIHEHLYRADDLTRVRLDEYLGQLLRTLGAAHANPRQTIQLTTELAPLTVEVKQAIPLGLITNELILNAYKHAFRDRPAGQLRVVLTGSAPSEAFCLVVEDDGVGLHEPAPRVGPPSLGMALVRMLAKQLKATLTIENSALGGTRFVLART